LNSQKKKRISILGLKSQSRIEVFEIDSHLTLFGLSSSFVKGKKNYNMGVELDVEWRELKKNYINLKIK